MKHIQDIMKSKHALRTISGVAAMSLLGAGFASYTTYAKHNHLAARTIPSVTTLNTDNSKELSDTLLGNMKITDRVIDKDETVYLITNADGSINHTIVSDHLYNRDGSSTIQDLSSLSDIENVKGDETFRQTGDMLTWQADGNDIYYQGTTSEAAPVTQKITYYLNDKKVPAEDLAGASGTVRIRFDYTNNSKYTEIVNGEKIVVSVPFAAITGIALPEDAKNVTITNGKLISTGNNNMAVGYTLPGLTESLNIKQEDLSDDIRIPEFFELSADVTNFELDTCMTVVINAGSLMSADGIDLSTADEMIDTLQDAASKLEDGSSELADGLDTLKGSLNEFSAGMKSLNEGLNEYTGGVGQVSSGATSAYAGSQELRAGFTGSEDRTGLIDGAKQVALGAGAINNGIQSIPSSMVSQMNQAKTATINELKTALTEDGVKLVYASCGVSELTPDNIGTVTDTFAGETARNTFAGIYSEAIKQPVTDEVTEQVMAEKDQITEEVTNEVMAQKDAITNSVTTEVLKQKDAITEQVTAEVMQQKDAITQSVSNEVLSDQELIDSVTASVTAEVMAQGMTDPAEIQAAIETGVQAQLQALIASKVQDTITDMITQNVQTTITNLVTEQVQTTITNMITENVTNTITDLITENVTETIKSQTTTQYTTILAGLNRASGAVQALSGVESNIQTSAASGDMKSLMDGADSLSKGASDLSTGVGTAYEGVQQLSSGLNDLSTGAQRLDSNSTVLRNGASELNKATGRIIDGVDQLNDGAHSLCDGMMEFNSEGIQKLVDAYTGDLKPLTNRLQAVIDASENYQTFTGIADGSNGNVKFIYKLPAIKKEA